MYRKSDSNKPEEKGVTGSTGAQVPSPRNRPVPGDDSKGKGKGKSDKRKESKKDEASVAAEALMGLHDSPVKKRSDVLDGNNDPETYTDGQKPLKFSNNFPSHWELYDSGLPPEPDNDIKFEPLFGLDTLGNIVPVGIRRIQSQPSPEIEKTSPRKDDGSRFFIPDGYLPDQSTPPLLPDLNKEDTRNSDDPPDKGAQIESLEEPVNSNKKKKKKKKKNKQKKEEIAEMSEEEGKDPNEIKCLFCKMEIPAEKMKRTAKCGHCFCSDCIHEYVVDKQKDEVDAFASLGCPKRNCKETLSDEEIFTFVNVEIRFIWLAFKNHFRMKKLAARLNAIKNVSREFMVMLSRIPCPK